MIFDGQDLRSVHHALSIEKEIPPGTASIAYETLSGTAGEIITERRVKQATYTARVNIVARSADDAWNVREKLAAWAHRDDIALRRLIPTHKPDRFYEAALESISDPEFKRGGAVVEVRFIVPRPYALDANERITYGDGSLEMTIGGSIICRPVIRQTIQTDREAVSWKLDGGNLLRVLGALSAGDVIEMDLKYGKVTVNGENAVSRLNHELTVWHPPFTPGNHRVGSSDDGAMEMRWRTEWA